MHSCITSFHFWYVQFNWNELGNVSSQNWMEIDQYTLMLININIKLVKSHLQYNDELILICYLWIFIFIVYIFSIL